MTSRLKTILLALVLIFQSVKPLLANSHSEPVTITVWSSPGQAVNRFVPSHAFGGAIDGHEKGEVDRMLAVTNIKEMLTAGLGPISYRLRTELAGEAWHWNSRGSWSEPNQNQGYWTSSAKAGEKLSESYGYRLPRRGNTTDQANDDGYSRLDDGDLNSFWKSNPYLDEYFTKEQNSKRPQWVLIDLGKEKAVDAIRLHWSAPFARVYDVEYGRFAGVDDISQVLPGVWHAFPQGRIHAGRGGEVTIRLSVRPVSTRFVRVLMKESSGTAERQTSDVRDRLGYAMREIYVGSLDHKNRFHDAMRHAQDNGDQTPIYVSSTDPWHRESDKDEMIEQPGFDRLIESGLTNALPMLVSVPVLYDTPENAAAEISYLKMRGYPLLRVELGEEPDGQFVAPEDYAALYIQFARAIHDVAPELKLGGPSFQDIEPGDKTDAVNTGKSEWLRRFLVYLKQKGQLDDYAFFSFEWYPFDNLCRPAAPQLARANKLLSEGLAEMQRGGLSKGIPWIMTEYGYSAFGGRVEMDLEGALLNADVVGAFLTLGGDQAFLYGYEPNEVIHEQPCTSGNNMLFLLGPDGNIGYRMPSFYGAQLLTREWARPGNEVHDLYRATVNKARGRESLVTAYAVHRPDNLWALLLINKDLRNSRSARVRFHNETKGAESVFAGEVDLFQYSKKQYELSSDQREPYPIRDQPPEHRRVKGSMIGSIELPPSSLTVIRGVMAPHASSVLAPKKRL
ncbi:MAG: discoidin protein [Acidobacteria bacterium]|nr:discoidin protein [Acidobacteriota bacterium]